MEIDFSQCWECREPVDPKGPFVLLEKDKDGVLETPDEIKQDGSYSAAHQSCEKDVIGTLRKIGDG